MIAAVFSVFLQSHIGCHLSNEGHITLFHLFILSVHRTGVKEPEDGFSDAQSESSDDDMDWSGSNSVFAHLSIPQLDGAADESSGKLYLGFLQICLAKLFRRKFQILCI